jgi:NADH:ubiquinone oxidoreductase subunit 4 (subunit M)
LQDYFEQNVFGRDNSTVIQLSRVGSLGNFALNVFSPFVQVLISIIGLKSSVLVATVLSTTGLVLASLSKQVRIDTCSF